MMRIMMTTLALLVAAPAAAQTSELPAWIVGTWCWDQRDDFCIRYEPPEDGGMAVVRPKERDGVVSWITTSRITIEDGKLVLRATNGQLLSREVSHGPNTMLLQPERTGSAGQALQIRYTLSGDSLTVEFILEGGKPPSIQRYNRQPEG